VNWYAVAFAITLIVIMIAAGYYLLRSWIRYYTHDSQSKKKPKELWTTILDFAAY